MAAPPDLHGPCSSLLRHERRAEPVGHRCRFAARRCLDPHAPAHLPVPVAWMHREGRRGAAGIAAALPPRSRGCAARMGREAARREGVPAPANSTLGAAAASSAPGAARSERGGRDLHGSATGKDGRRRRRRCGGGEVGGGSEAEERVEREGNRGGRQ
jgi:hypothetical protein